MPPRPLEDDGAPAPESAAAASPDVDGDEGALYMETLRKAQRNAGHAEPPTYRVVLCGDLGAGKRTAGFALRESLAFGERTRVSAKKYYGVDYSFVDVRRQDGSKLHTVEFIAIDTPQLLDVALQEINVRSTVVCFACDASSPRSSITGVAKWAALVNEHVASLVGADAAKALARTRYELGVKTHEALKELLPPILVKAVPEENPTDSEVCETPCALPSFVLVTKTDLTDTLPARQVTLSPGCEVSSERFLRDAIRTQAAKIGAGTIILPDTRTGGDIIRELIAGIAEHLAAVAADPTALPDTSALAGAFGCDLQTLAGQFLPAGADDGRTIPQEISAEAIALVEVFPASLESMAAATTAASYESHQSVLQRLAANVGVGTSASAASPQPVRVSEAARDASQTPLAGAKEGSVAPGAAATDDADFDFMDKL